MMHTGKRDGYILIMSILVTGIVASAVVISTLILGTDALRTSYTIEESSKSIALSQACMEHALKELREDPTYGGGEILSDFSVTGSCTVFPIGGAGNNDRIICAEATTGSVTRRMEVIVQSLLPQTVIYSWQEVPFFSLCF